MSFETLSVPEPYGTGLPLYFPRIPISPNSILSEKIRPVAFSPSVGENLSPEKLMLTDISSIIIRVLTPLSQA